MSPSLGQEMNAATRPLHTTLNRLILSLLPLSLPPYTPTPQIYATGLSSFLPIYRTFENAFTHTLTSPSTTPRLLTLLSSLHIPSLERTGRLQADLALLLPGGTSRRRTYGPHLTAFVAHIEDAVKEKPHLLLAYTWNMYMALFSGGRYLRAQLRAANAQAWHVTHTLPVSHIHAHAHGVTQDPDIDEGRGDADADAPLQFWCFDGDSDGEDIKAEFKARFAEVEVLLTDDERSEIVAEAVEIMKGLIAVVRELEAEAAAEPQVDMNTGSSKVVTIPASVLGTIASFTWGIAEYLGWRHGAKAAVPLA